MDTLSPVICDKLVNFGSFSRFVIYGPIIPIKYNVNVLELNPNSTDFYGLFYCCAVPPLSQVRGRVERSQTCLTPPHTLCACPKPGTCSPVVVVVFMFLLLFVLRFFNRLGRLSSFMNSFTFLIFVGPFTACFMVWIFVYC